MSSAIGTQTEITTTLSRADLEELIKHEAKPGSPVLSVFLDTDQSRVHGPAAERLQEYGKHRCIFAVVNATA